MKFVFILIIETMFKDPEVKPLIESVGNIYDSTVISSYFYLTVDLK